MINGRQIDVAIRSDIAGYPVLIIVECKDYARRVEVGNVDELVGKLNDVGAVSAVLVSNSGFSDKAIARAKKDPRIQLSSVFDVTNNKLRSQLQAPVVCEFRGIKSYKLRLANKSTSGFRVSPEDMLKLQRHFTEMWNEGKLMTEVGEHEYVEAGIPVELGNADVTYLYQVSKRLFVGMAEVDFGSGIYNVSTGGLTTKEFGFSIDAQEVESGWKQIDESELSKLGHAALLMALDTYPLPSSEQPLY